ncbi:kinase-like protein [Aureobasidium pullulans]|nr:kinase-like protein [Aureobasidium pullulans]
MISTVVGDYSGRVYIRGNVLQRNQADDTLSISKAKKSGTESFVVKRVSRPFYDLSIRLAAEFTGTRRLRMHVDRNQDEGVLIYPYFDSTLLALIQNDPEMVHTQRKKILRYTAEAIQELHSRNWIHIDIKPDNILVNLDGGDTKEIANAVLGDFDIAYRLEDGKALRTRHAIGNAMWRSPEGQTAVGVTKASDIYSFGLLCIYAMGGGELLLLENYQDLVRFGITPEQEVLSRHFTYFGPVPDALYRRVDDEAGCELLRDMSKIADATVESQPERRFLHWSKELGPVAQDAISQMATLDPTTRPTIEQVLAHPWWQED